MPRIHHRCLKVAERVGEVVRGGWVWFGCFAEEMQCLLHVGLGVDDL